MQNNPGPNDPTYPPYPPPPMMQPPRKRRVWLWVLLGVFVLAVLGCVGILAASQGTQTGTQPQATTAAGNTPTAKGTATMAITHGTPHIGGPISDFYGKYGKPKNAGAGGSQTWIASQSPSIIVNAATDSSGKVNNMNVVGEPSWSRKYTETYCTRFLPPDARAFNRIKSSSDTLIDYHSSSGQIAMTVLDMGSCTLIIAGS